jgi:hypothetical protein
MKHSTLIHFFSCQLAPHTNFAAQLLYDSVVLLQAAALARVFLKPEPELLIRVCVFSARSPLKSAPHRR